MVARDYSLRVATPDDAAAVDALLQASYPRLMASSYDEAVLLPALKLVTTANPSLLASGTYYVAVAQDEFLVGCGGWTLERPGTLRIETGVAHVRHFGTHPDWINRGVGRAIYRLCETAARSAGVVTFECYSSLNAASFYSALGFKVIRSIDIELRPDVVLPAVWMRRQIQEAPE